MVGNLVILLLVAVIGGVQQVVPSVDTQAVTSGVAAIGQDVFSWLQVLQPVVDVSVLVAVVDVLVTMQVAAVAFRLANYVFNHLPLIGAFG